MFKFFMFLVPLFLLSGCFTSSPPLVIKSSEKVFPEEDAYILFALRAEELADYNASSSIYNTLYVRSNKKEYLYRSLQNDLMAGYNQRVVKRIEKLNEEGVDDFSLTRMKVIGLMQLEKIEEAKQIAINLVNTSGMVDDYILLSDIYVKQNRFDTAVKYLESAYAKDYNEQVLDKMAIVLYVNMQRKKDAIAQLETHSRVHGCSKTICSRLIGFYSNDNNIDGLLSTYLRLYKIDSSDDIAKQIVQIYAYKKDYYKLIDFLEESRIDDELLLQLYTNVKNYKKAYPLAQKLYIKSGEINFLAQSAVFEYEASEDKNSKDMQDRVIRKLKKVLKIEESPLYLNYLGYLMIDHEINVEDGIGYVKKALIFEPNSVFYLDSLAWGYYKLGECKKAQKIIKSIVNMEGGDDDEVLSHLNTINKCVKIKNKKGKRKK